MAIPFLVVGAMKSGTTTLHAILQHLSGVELVTEKESSALLDEPSATRLAETMKQSSAGAVGEVSTAYMQRPLTEVDTHGVVSLLGMDLVVIAALRDPFRRAVSHWRHWEQLNMNGGQSLSSALLDGSGPYVAFSRYAYQLRPWIDAVGRDRVLPLRLEDYAQDAANWVMPVCSALGVTAPKMVEQRHANAGNTRVVAGGPGRHFMASPAYRRLIRPLTPQWIRRAGAITLGGRRGGHETPEIPGDVEDGFRMLIEADMGELASWWPHLRWESSA